MVEKTILQNQYLTDSVAMAVHMTEEDIDNRQRTAAAFADIYTPQSAENPADAEQVQTWCLDHFPDNAG